MKIVLFPDSNDNGIDVKTVGIFTVLWWKIWAFRKLTFIRMDIIKHQKTLR